MYKQIFLNVNNKANSIVLTIHLVLNNLNPHILKVLKISEHVTDSFFFYWPGMHWYIDCINNKYSERCISSLKTVFVDKRKNQSEEKKTVTVKKIDIKQVV